jgi:hypothetical protein
MTFDYNLDNFLKKPSDGDQRLIISDKNNKFVDSITPDISHYFVKNNCLIIKITNKNDLILSFETRFIAQQALEKLNYYRKLLLSYNGVYNRNIIPMLNILNRNMICRDDMGTEDHKLATDAVVQQQPLSRVEVIVNGSIHITCGLPNTPGIGCYFISPLDVGDLSKARRNDGDVKIGDQLYWIGSVANFYLDSTDYLDYDYLV